MNEPRTAPAPTMIDVIVNTSAFVLAGFCVIEVALPRAGRAAATLLLRSDSDVLRMLESWGARSSGVIANGVMVCAIVVLTATLARRMRTPGVVARAAVVLVAAAGFAVFAFRARGVAFAWWALLAGCAVTIGALFRGRPRGAAAGAIALQCGVAGYAAWALSVVSGGAARSWLDQASEVLVLSGIALAGLPGPPVRTRRVLFVSALVAIVWIACAIAAPGAWHAIARHLVSAGNSGLPFAVTAALLAGALAAIVASTARTTVAAALVVAMVCARRPEAFLIAGALASAALLIDALVDQSSLSSES